MANAQTLDEIARFLKDSGVFYLATTDEGGGPSVRPFGFAAALDGRLYFATGSGKQVYRQLLARPAVEIAGTRPDNAWIRLRGRAVFEPRPELKRKAFDAFPRFAGLYGAPENPAFALFYLEDASAVIYPRGGEPQVLAL